MKTFEFLCKFCENWYKTVFSNDLQSPSHPPWEQTEPLPGLFCCPQASLRYADLRDRRAPSASARHFHTSSALKCHRLVELQPLLDNI